MDYLKSFISEEKKEKVIIDDNKYDERCSYPSVQGCYNDNNIKHGLYCKLHLRCLKCNADLSYNNCELHSTNCVYYLPIKCNSFNICKEDGVHWFNCPSYRYLFSTSLLPLSIEEVLPPAVISSLEEINKNCTSPEECYSQNSLKHGLGCSLCDRCIICNCDLQWGDNCELHSTICKYYLPIKCNDYYICKQEGIHSSNCISSDKAFKD